MDKDKILLKLAQRVKELRRARNISQEQLAEAADLHPTYIGKIERHGINPSLFTLEKIAAAFRIPLSELLSFAEDKKIYDASAVLLVDSLARAAKELKVARDLARDYKPKKKS